MNIEEQIERDEFSVKLSLALKSICPTEGPFPRKPEIQVKKKIVIETRNGDEFTVEEYEKQRGKVDWVQGLLQLKNRTRIFNCLCNEFDNGLVDRGRSAWDKKIDKRIAPKEKRVLDLNNPKHRKKIRQMGNRHIDNFGKTSKIELYRYLNQHWPWDNYE